MDWQQEGREPDYRFSLANERTSLAWMRAALALLAAAVLLAPVRPPGSSRTGCWSR
jgi:putative membrane protein